MTKAEINAELITLYQEMYALTNPLCKQCRAPQSCCSPEYCEEAILWAKEKWGEDISTQAIPGNAIPFLDQKTGCRLPPHLRPTCTYHHCDINSLGFFKNDHDLITTHRYFDLRTKIDNLEYKKEYGPQ